MNCIVIAVMLSREGDAGHVFLTPPSFTPLLHGPGQCRENTARARCLQLCHYPRVDAGWLRGFSVGALETLVLIS